MRRADRQRRRTAAVFAASTLVHLLILGLLARYTVARYPVQIATRDFQVDLVPLAPLASALGRAERNGAAPETAARATPRAVKPLDRHANIPTTAPFPQPPGRAPEQTRRPPPPLAQPTPPAPPTAHFLPQGAGPWGQPAGSQGFLSGAQGPAGVAQGDGDDQGAGVRGALRTSVGCDDPDYLNLSKAELAACHREYGVQAAIGRRQYVDPISSAKVRNQYEQDRQACERINHYATPLDSDREHSAHAPGSGFDRWRC